MSFESAVYRLVDEPANPNCVRNCVRPPNVPRSLTGIDQHPTRPSPAADASSISRCWPASIVHLNRPEATREDRVDSICLAQRPVRPVVVTDGDLFDEKTAIKHVFVNGRPVTLAGK